MGNLYLAKPYGDCHHVVELPPPKAGRGLARRDEGITPGRGTGQHAENNQLSPFLVIAKWRSDTSLRGTKLRPNASIFDRLLFSPLVWTDHRPHLGQLRF